MRATADINQVIPLLEEVGRSQNEVSVSLPKLPEEDNTIKAQLIIPTLFT